jgi:hypothetical protein
MRPRRVRRLTKKSKAQIKVKMISTYYSSSGFVFKKLYPVIKHPGRLTIKSCPRTITVTYSV